MAQRDKQYKVPVLQLVTPPDGLCCYHCINAISLGDEWKSVSRLSNGFAVNPRIRKSEAETAKALRQKAIQSTPNDSQLQDLARDAMKYLSVDILELPWLATVLDLAIRCTVQDEAG